eukprot:Em0012g222a
MAETAHLFQLLQNQMEEQRKQMEEGRKQTEALIAAFIEQRGQQELEQPSPKAPLVVIPSFDPFDLRQNCGKTTGRALFFLTNQSRVIYKFLSNLASQQSPSKDVNALTLDEIVEYMKGMQFDPTCTLRRPRAVHEPQAGVAVPLSVLPEAWRFGSSLFEPVRPIFKYLIGTVKATETVPRLQQSVLIQGKQFMFEVDTGAAMAITSALKMFGVTWRNLPCHLPQDGMK